MSFKTSLEAKTGKKKFLENYKDWTHLEGLHMGKKSSFEWWFQWKIILMTNFWHVCMQIRITNANHNYEFKF